MAELHSLIAVMSCIHVFRSSCKCIATEFTCTARENSMRIFHLPSIVDIFNTDMVHIISGLSMKENQCPERDERRFGKKCWRLWLADLNDSDSLNYIIHILWLPVTVTRLFKYPCINILIELSTPLNIHFSVAS